MEHHRKDLQLSLRPGQAALFRHDNKTKKAMWMLMHKKLSSTRGVQRRTCSGSLWRLLFHSLPGSRLTCYDLWATLPLLLSMHLPLCVTMILRTVKALVTPVEDLVSQCPFLACSRYIQGAHKNSPSSVACHRKDRRQITCGLASQMGAISHHPHTRGQLFQAAQRLLHFVITGPRKHFEIPQCRHSDHGVSPDPSAP